MTEMKPFIFIFIIPLLIITGYFLSVELLNTYNTQQDRQMFLKSYEIVLECRKDATVINMDKVCGTIPTFVSEVS
jgi:hypothetical protein